MLPPLAAVAEETSVPANDASMGATMDPLRAGKFGLDLGSAAPDFSATTYDGREIQLRRDYLSSGGWTVIGTWPGGTTSIADNPQLQRFIRTSPLFGQQNARVLMVTTDSPELTAAYLDGTALPFDLLIDPEGKIFRDYRLLDESGLPDVREPNLLTGPVLAGSDSQEAVAAAERLGARPSVMIVDPEGILRYVRVDPDADSEQSPLTDEEIIQELSRLQNPVEFE